MKAFIKQVDLLSFQAIYLLVLCIVYTCLLSNVVSLPFLVTACTCLLKLFDKLMQCSNHIFHLDVFFLLNVAPYGLLLSCYDDALVLSMAVYIFIVICILESYIHKQWNIESKLYRYLFRMQLASYVIIMVIVPIFLHGVESIQFHVSLVLLLAKAIAYFHFHAYRFETGFYNDLLREVGGAESPMSKNVGYHLVTYTFKMVVLGVCLPFLFVSNIIWLCFMVSITSLVCCFLLYMILQDAKFVLAQRRNLNEIEEQSMIHGNIDEHI
jgi:hypothetical protein